VFLTNHFGLPALTIAALYKNRWQVELFFKWIKQHLRIVAYCVVPGSSMFSGGPIVAS
jgi:IS4 transposase